MLKKKHIHILGLIACTCYLFGNLYYSMNDTADWSCVKETVNSAWFFRPMACMHGILIYIAFEDSKKHNWIITEFWRFYLLLAISEIGKMFISNPTVETYNEYIFCIIAFITLIYKIFSHAYKPR